MGQESLNQMLHQGIAAARAGQREAARTILQNVVRLDPRNEIAWMWLSSVAADDTERLFCLKKLLEINPANEFALKGLKALGVEPGRGAGEQVGSTVIPTLDESKYTRVLQAVDDFLRRYQAGLFGETPAVVWSHKRKGRYAESGATRLRQAMAAAAVLLLVVLVGGGFLALRASGLLEGPAEPEGHLITRMPSQTPRPTFTPTKGGPTPTDFPQPMAVPPTEIPAGLVAGDPFALAEPTEIYPRVHPNVARIVQEAAGYYTIAEYETARDMLRTERERSGQHCYPMLVYYEALSLAGLRDFQEAMQLLEWAQNFRPERGYSTCQDEPIILAGMAEVLYQQDPRSTRALELATEALREDGRLVQAAVVKARLEMARSDWATARSTIAQALVERPNDLNLLVVAAEIELDDNQPAVALNYVGRALYMDPALLPALHLQAKAYLRLAEDSGPGTRQLQYYGLAVRSAQSLLLYYPGDPAGYLYLAEARLGEGNLQMAESALARILENADSLPEESDAVILQAYELRGMLHLAQGRYNEARADLRQAVFADDGSLRVEIAEHLADVAMRLGDYADAQSWVSQLVVAQPQNSTYQLWHAQLLIEVCSLYPGKLSCSYAPMMAKLSDSFISTLADEDQQAEAHSLRAQAQYHLTLQQQGASLTGQGRLALQLALNDLVQALLVRDDPIDQYYRALILEALNDPARAAESYRWVRFWAGWYHYPFVDPTFEAHAAEVEEQAQVWWEEQARPTATPTPTPTLEPTIITRTPPGGPTQTGTPTATPPTALPEQIP